MSMSERDELERFFNEAVNDFEEASGKLEDPAMARKALAQALMWAYGLHEWLRKHHPQYDAWFENEPAHDYFHGAQYVRDIGTHNYTKMVKCTDGATLPFVLQQPLFDLEWRPLSELPVPDKKFTSTKSTQVKQGAYRTHLEGKPARSTLAWLSDLFKRAPR